MTGFGSALLISFGAIFVAELGDKSQLMAMAFAARFKPLPILLGITVATAIVHAMSVVIGVVLGAALPTRAITIVTGIAFLGFAAWTVRGDQLSEGDEEKVEQAKESGTSPIVAASVAFGLSELGDKTMLATITLATQHGPVGTWLGSTLGMVAADALAIAVGAWLGSRLPERFIRIGAAVLFVLFGVYLIVEGVRA